MGYIIPIAGLKKDAIVVTRLGGARQPRQRFPWTLATRSESKQEQNAECSMKIRDHFLMLWRKRLIGSRGRVQLWLCDGQRATFQTLVTRPGFVFGLGTLFGVSLVWNRLANLVLVDGARARADLVGAIASSALLLYAASAWQVDVRSTAPLRIRDGRYLEKTATSAFDEKTTSALVWLTDTLFAACPFITTAVWLEAPHGRVVAHRGMVKTELDERCDLSTWIQNGLIGMDEANAVRYCADLKALPANLRMERLLPRDTQAAWIGSFRFREEAPDRSSRLILMLGCNKVRPFLDKDLDMLANLQRHSIPFG
jgi:hypothetical protein